MTAAADDKRDIQRFWGGLYKSLYTEVDSGLTREELLSAIDDLEDMFRSRAHGAVVEMPIDQLAGKKVLEIGCGAGGHSVLFARKGAVMTSVDLTPVRAAATQAKFDLLSGLIDPACHALQADAEALPFPDASFDIVYSNGVLHHTRDTEKAIAEVHRVLKPGGLAVIMLYCKDSWHYWFNLWFCVGLLQGKGGREHWVGRATEWGGRDQQTVENPITRCYSRAEMQQLFAAFEGLTLRKGEFYFYLIPKLGRLYRRWQIRRYGVHPGGRLVYGEPWPIQAPLEQTLGRWMGWAWFSTARKPGGV